MKPCGTQARAQDIFDTVAVHLIEQGEPSVDATGSCQYRDGVGANGKMLMCAIGCLIPDEMYDKVRMEGKPI